MNEIVAWMFAKGYVTGHGDTVEDLLREIELQVAEQCAKVCHAMAVDQRIHSLAGKGAWRCATAIRAKFCKGE